MSHDDKVCRLLPCPFCGSDDVDRHFALTDLEPGKKYDPGCMKCGATAPIEVWNKAPRSAARDIAPDREECHFGLPAPTSSERATVPAKIRGYAQHFQVHRHHAVAEMAEFILSLTEPVAPNSATSAQLLEALRVALGESSSMTLPEVRALLARSEGRDA